MIDYHRLLWRKKRSSTCWLFHKSSIQKQILYIYSSYFFALSLLARFEWKWSYVKSYKFKKLESERFQDSVVKEMFCFASALYWTDIKKVCWQRAAMLCLSDQVNILADLDTNQSIVSKVFRTLWSIFSLISVFILIVVY